MLWRFASLLLGVFACSTSVILIKLSHTPPAVLASVRLLIAVVLLSPLFWLDLRAHRHAYTRTHLRRSLLPAFVLALHFLSWTYGARLTLAAQATLIVNLSPIAIPFFLHALARERINRTEILGTALGIGGIVLLSAHDALTATGNVWGNLICFGSMLLFAWYLALGRRNRDFPSLWLYVVPVYLFAGLFCLVAAIPQLPDFAFRSGREWMLLLGMALLPTILGHSLLNLAMRHLRGQVVSLFNVGQFIFAAAMAYLLFGEHPSPVFYAASAIVIAGIALVVLAAPSHPPRLR